MILQSWHLSRLAFLQYGRTEKDAVLGHQVGLPGCPSHLVIPHVMVAYVARKEYKKEN